MRSRFTIFAGVLFSVVVASDVFVAATWTHFSGFAGPGWWLALLLVTAGFVPALMLGFRFHHPALRGWAFLSSSAMGFLSFWLVAAVACWLVSAGARLAGSGFDPQRLAIVAFGAGTLVALYGLANSVLPRSVTVRVALPNLPAAWEGRTVALISDVHLGNIRGRRFARHLVRRLIRAKPEAVFISGDMFDGTRLDLPAAVQPWSELQAPRGVFFVSGNHDDMRGRGRHLEALGSTGIRILNNEKITVDGLQIVGVHDAETHRPEIFREILRRAEIDRSRASILLAHQPSNLEIPEEAGLSLQLSGHTHGGQFWPWSLIARRVHGKFVHGLNRFGNLQVYTSSGAGTWGPPFRVGTRSEIVFLRLENQ